MQPREQPRGRYLYGLALAALGVVYGDIGTSPLYAHARVLPPARTASRPRTRTCSACCR